MIYCNAREREKKKEVERVKETIINGAAYVVDVVFESCGDNASTLRRKNSVSFHENS